VPVSQEIGLNSIYLAQTSNRLRTAPGNWN